MSANHARRWKSDLNNQPEKQTKKITVKVHKQSWITKGEKLLYTIAGACLIAAGLYTVSYSSNTDQLNRSVINLESTIKQQATINDGLIQDVKEYSRPERIIQIAKEAGLEPQNAEVKQANGLAR